MSSEQIPPPGDFEAAAAYYDRFRSRYPAGFYDELRRRFGGGRLLVDLGCGTGRVILRLAPHFDRALAVEPSDAMRTIAEAEARRRGLGNCSFSAARAEDVELEDASVSLCVAAQAFHWMDRELVLGRLHRALEAGGALVVVDYEETPHPLGLEPLRSAWQRYGERRRPGGRGFDEEMERHEAVIARSPFGPPERVEVPGEPDIFDADRVLGYLASTSYCSPPVVAARREAFERDVRAAFAEMADSDGTLTVTQRLVLRIARR